MTVLPAAGTHRVTVSGTDLTFEVAAGERLLAAARRAGVWLPFECGWGSCGTCKVTVEDGETELLYAAAPAVSDRDARRRRVVACQSTARSDLVIRPTRTENTPPAERPVRDHVGELVAREDLGPDLARFHVRLGEPAAYHPGQHAVLDLGAGLRRCYSMAGLPGSDQIAFIAKRYAGKPGSEALFALEEGTPIGIELPYGDSWLRPGVRPVVLVAGGTGISAVLALTQHLAAGAHDGRDVHVYYGAGSEAELVCWDELEAAVGRIPGGRLAGAVLTGSPRWTGTRGFVTDALAVDVGSLGEADVYVTGPPVMAEATRALLRERGVPIDRIHVDCFG